MILTSRKTYTVGDKVKTKAKFVKNKVNTDPTTISLKFQSGVSGTPTTWVYGVNAEIVRTAAGLYEANFSVTASGEWFYKWTGVGVADGAAERRVIVRETEF